MKIVILGAKGNLGTQLEKIFAGHQLYSWDREDFNFLDFDDLRTHLSEAMPDLVINAAAYNAVDKCETDEKEKELAFCLNGDLPAALADWCGHNDSVLIHYSTDYVFGNDMGSGEFSEDDAISPINVYGQSKADGEAAIKEKIGAGNFYIIRTSKLFGPAGKSPFSKPSFFQAIAKAAQERGEIEVVDSELSCFTYTPDLAQATKELVFGKKDRGIYHIINSGPATWYMAAVDYFSLAGIKAGISPVSPDKFPRPAKRPQSSILLNTKLPALRDFREALEEYIKIQNI